MNHIRRIRIVLIFLVFSFLAHSENSYRTVKGEVSFISSQHVYVKFQNTMDIKVGDTLFLENNSSKPIPALLVSNISSISCVGTALNGQILQLGMPLFARVEIHETIPEVVIEKKNEATAINAEIIDQITKKEKNNRKTNRVNGRLSVSSYSNFSNNFESMQRFKYNLALRIDSVANTGITLDSYLSFTHKTNQEIVLNDALKIYSLNIRYDTKKLGSVTLGRNINPVLANVGAIDGLQYEKKLNNFTVGAIAGTRPDIYTYGFNTSYLQFGVFAAHHFNAKKGFAQTTVSLINQMNNSLTDRRFAYLQHSNSLIDKVTLFSSFEIDLYGLKNNQPSTEINLTSVYLSMRYKPIKKLAISLSYDARKNVYYYETYKNIADSILDKETRQGLRLQTIYRPLDKLTWGVTGGARFPTETSSISLNTNTYFSYEDVPWIGGTAKIDFTALKTNALSGLIYGGSFSRDLLNNKIYAELSYQYVNYKYLRSSSLLNQNIIDFDINWRIANRLMLSLNFEGIIDNEKNNSGRVFINLTKRF